MPPMARLIRVGTALATAVLLCALAASSAGAYTATPQSYFGGPVMSRWDTAQVLWTYNGATETASVADGIAQFLGDVAHDSGQPTNVFAMLPEYSTVGATSSDGGHPGNTSQTLAYASSFLGRFTISPSHTSASITDADVAAELTAQIGAGHLPAPTTADGGPATVYVVTLPSTVTLCSSSGGGCSGTQFCDLFGDGVFNGMKYGWVATTDFPGYDSGCGPGTLMQAETYELSGYLGTLVTEPLITDVGGSGIAYPAAWYANGDCVSTTCGGLFFSCDLLNPNDSTTNTIDGHTWTVARLWSNVRGACVGDSRYASPTAAFASAPGSGSVAFDASASAADPASHVGTRIPAGIASYAWDFGDGTSGSGAAPVHAYGASGTYHVMLTVTDSLGFSASVAHDVSVTVPAGGGGGGGGAGGGSGGNGGGGAAGALLVGLPSAKGAGASVRLVCSGGGDCIATVRLTLTELLRGGKLVGVSARSRTPRVRRKRVTVGQATVVLRGGETRVVTVALNRTGAKLLKRRRKLPVTLTVAQLPASGSARTLLTKRLTLRRPAHR